MVREPSIQELARHVEDLSSALKIALLDVVPGQVPEAGVSFVLSRYGGQSAVIIAPVVDEATYAIALHEMGHCLSPTGSVRGADTVKNYNLILLEEESAWEWARRHALIWTVTMQHVELQAMENYREGQRRDTVEKIKRATRVNETLSDFLRRSK